MSENASVHISLTMRNFSVSPAESILPCATFLRIITSQYNMCRCHRAQNFIDYVLVKVGRLGS